MMTVRHKCVRWGVQGLSSLSSANDAKRVVAIHMILSTVATMRQDWETFAEEYLGGPGGVSFSVAESWWWCIALSSTCFLKAGSTHFLLFCHDSPFSSSSTARLRDFIDQTDSDQTSP